MILYYFAFVNDFSQSFQKTFLTVSSVSHSGNVFGDVIAYELHAVRKRGYIEGFIALFRTGGKKIGRKS